MTDHAVSRRAVLGGLAGLAAAGAAPPAVAHAGVAPVGTAPRGPAHAGADLIDLRRDLHRHPELPGHERRTAAVVARRLRAAGLDVTTGVGGHGVVAVLSGSRPGRTVAYRADMDAVPPQDQAGGTGEVAHLCGHDLHTTIAVGVAEALARHRDRLAGTVVFLLQPAEETLTGAAAMLADGVLTRTRPTEIHALHCAQFPVGQFVVTPGTGLPGRDQATITLTGAGATTRAELLATRINELSTVARPTTSADLEQLTTDIQTPHGPLARFVFAQARAVPTVDGEAEVRLSYRCWPENRYRAVRHDIERLARSAGPATVSFPADPFPAMRCPEREGNELKRHLQRTIGPDRVLTLRAPIPFSGEDFALFLNHLPGTYTFLGVRTPGTDIATSYPHFGTFTPDERAIAHGVRAMTSWLATRTAT